MHRRLVLLGPPAAGKGTQAELLSRHFGFQAPSVGAMLREQKAAGTQVGLRAAQYFERGLLVPDEITIEIVRQWLAANDGSWVLDGFPRTVPQAEAFDAMLQEQNAAVDLALLLEVDEPTIRDRVLHRLVCQSCGAIFRSGLHADSPGSPCPRCGAPLTRRADDTLDALVDRLIEYQTKTAPVIDYYQTHALLRRINGALPVEQVFTQITTALKAESPATP